MCEEESEDTEAVAKLFEINDSIHRTLERYKLIKKGDFDAASKIPKGTLGTSTGVSKTADSEHWLIDLGPNIEESSQPTGLIDLDVDAVDSAPNAAGKSNDNAKSDEPLLSLQDDLLGLSFHE